MTTTPTLTASPSIIFRRGRVTDALALAEVGRRMFTEAHSDAFTAADLAEFLRQEWSVARLAEDLVDPANTVFVAADGPRPVGLTMLKPAPVPGSDAPGTELGRVYLDGAYVGRGIGARLVDMAIAAHEARGEGVLWLHAWEHNARAIPLYESRGFRIADRHEMPFRSSTPRVVMMVCERRASNAPCGPAAAAAG